MKSVTRIAVVDPNDSARSALKTLLLSIDTVWLEAECARYEFFADVVLQTQPDLALISLDNHPQKALDLIARIHQELPACQILALSSSQEGSLILQAIRNGAREFLNQPLKLDDFLAALDRMRHSSLSRAGEVGQTPSSQVITIAGVSGGVGCTSLAINLGCCLAQLPHRSVAVLDLDLALGDADVWLDIIPDYTIQDVTENIARLDYALLKRSLTKHECGAFLLPRPIEFEAGRAPITPEELRRVIALLKATFSRLVIDISKCFTPLDVAAMEAADHILLVTQLDLPCLRNAVRLLQYFQKHESLNAKVKLVVNRLGLEDSQISMTKALETLGREVFATIPNDYATMVEARNNGVPLITQAPRAKVTKAVQHLAALLDGGTAVDDERGGEKKARKGLFSFLGASAAR
uniref:CobQ/CobB/MinD/ParA nucleotide binding domain-containing protein n=1 Tax=Schlesneria paludicola TaxID=360056 RepID=A0A7C4QR29_9PLAN